MKNEEIMPGEAMELWMAALYGAPALAVELERLGICDLDESLENAQRLRPSSSPPSRRCGEGRKHSIVPLVANYALTMC
jgi:hypothetical protein